MLEAQIQKRIGALDIHADLRVPPGFTVLFGPSGAGKSTILRMIAGLTPPDRGTIALNCRKLFDDRTSLPPRQRRTGFVFQDGCLFPHMTVAENLRFAAGPSEAIDRLVEEMDLADLLPRRPATLSGGERQRVALARALLGRPECLLMDEPMASLDAARKDELLPVLNRLRADAGLPVVYVTHSVEEAFRLADRIQPLANGRTGQACSVADFFSNPETAGPVRGGVLSGTVMAHHPNEVLTEIAIAGERVFVARSDHAIGATTRLRLQAGDIAIATSRPDGLSILNRLSVRIEQIGAEIGGNHALMLRLDDGQRLTASLTGRALRELDLRPGQQAVALFKTVPLSPDRLD